MSWFLVSVGALLLIAGDDAAARNVGVAIVAIGVALYCARLVWGF